MSSTKPRFSDSSSWEATDEEARTLRIVRETVLDARAAHARIDAIEAGAFAAAARVAEAQTGRCADGSEYAFPWRSAALELAAALHLAPGEVEARLRHDHVLQSRFPIVAAALADQVVTRRQVDIIREHGENLREVVLEEYQHRALTHAEEATPAQLRVFVKWLAGELDPEPLPERHVRATSRRGTRVRPLDDGLAEFVLVDEAAKITAIQDRLTTTAKTIAAEEKRMAAEERRRRAAAGPGTVPAARPGVFARNAFGMRVAADGVAVDTRDRTHTGPVNGDRRTVRLTLPGCSMVREHVEVFHDGTWYPHDDPALPLRPTAEQLDAATGRVHDARTRDQIRADLATDLLLTGAPTTHTIDGSAEKVAAIRGTVAVTIAATTLAGLDDGPAMLAGYGPIPADIARRFAADAPGWERIFQNPDTGALHTVDHYTPTAAIRRLVELRDGTCRAPGCMQPAHRCEKDHTVEWERGGPTCAGNLSALCKPHHLLRHHTPWKIHQPEPGKVVWTSPLGFEYATDPPPQTIHTGRHSPVGALHPPGRSMPGRARTPVDPDIADDLDWTDDSHDDDPPPW
ncbi:HNH endonuclease signature motif containing protein [Microbacterium gilvum]|uniref:HNH nuclease domain-containing protein n=1 Tax=Microbacterium gilvum TaxID=1336204 RepID=A0ABP9AHF0_9MICO